MTTIDLDVVVVGCGISGISSGYHLQKYCPDRSFVILERRKNLGGTWDLMKYPGIRSDSDMYTFGYGWRAWTADCIISPGEEIIKYLNETVDEIGLRDKIEFETNVVNCSFSSETCKWTVQAEKHSGPVTYTCTFLLFNTGYYDYENPYSPDFVGMNTFKGKIIHPQLWDESYNYENKKVVVIGSGATAATLVPVMAKRGASKVTMLQRSPTYFVTRPGSHDFVYNTLKYVLGSYLAFKVTYWKYLLTFVLVYKLCRMFPQTVKGVLIKGIKDQVPKNFDVKTHFNPKYGPWEQRVCLIPDGDFFQEINNGKVDVVTDHIDKFTEKGVRLKSGKELEADLVVTATGLTIQPNFPMSTVCVTVDGKPYVPRDCFFYRACMLSDIPNFAFTFGYANASWTLKSDLVSKYVCDLLNYMKKHKYLKVCPRKEPDLKVDPTKKFFDLSAGYLDRARENLPRLGPAPWELPQNVLLDMFKFQFLPWGKELEFTPKAGL